MEWDGRTCLLGSAVSHFTLPATSPGSASSALLTPAPQPLGADALPAPGTGAGACLEPPAPRYLLRRGRRQLWRCGAAPCASVAPRAAAPLPVPPPPPPPCTAARSAPAHAGAPRPAGAARAGSGAAADPSSPRWGFTWRGVSPEGPAGSAELEPRERDRAPRRLAGSSRVRAHAAPGLAGLWVR